MNQFDGEFAAHKNQSAMESLDASLITGQGVHLCKGGKMTLAVGKLEKLSQWKHGNFGGYEVRGKWSADTQLKRAWHILLDGLDSGWFEVCNGEIRRARLEYFAGPSGEASATISPEIADLRVSAKKAISDAITQWETEVREGPLHL
jgi:hypothetical protein